MLDFVLVHLAATAFAAAFGLGFESFRRGRAGLMAAARLAAGAGIALAAAVLVRRGLALGAFPIASSYETHVFVAAVISVVALAVDLARRMPVVTLATAPLSLLALLVGSLMGGPGDAPREHLRSAWTGLHVLGVLTAYGAFALAFVAGVLYLVEQRKLKTAPGSPVLGAMPSLESIRRLMVGAIAVGVALHTVGIVVGYMYARRADLAPGWRVDAKVWSATITWALYLVVLVLSFVPAFKGRRTAIASVASFFAVIATLWCAAFWSSFHRFP